MHSLGKNRPSVICGHTSVDTDWWKEATTYSLRAREQLALVWYWMEGTPEDLEHVKPLFISGSRATQWRVKKNLKEKGIFPTEKKEVYASR